MALIDDIQQTFAPYAQGANPVSQAASPFATQAANAFSPLAQGSNQVFNQVNPWATKAAAAYQSPFAQGGAPASEAIAPWASQAQSGYSPFTTGPLGNSEATQAYMRAFTQNTLPTIQHQAQLQGLGSGPTVADITGRSLATALPQFMQNDATNRLQAAQGMSQIGSQLALPASQADTQNRFQEGQGLASIGSNLILPASQADTSNRLQGAQGLLSTSNSLASASQADAANRLQAGSGLTNLGSQVVIPGWNAELAQQGQALQGYQSAGELTRGITQDVFDAQREEMLRLQGLSESGTFGAFGTMSPLTKTETQQSGGK